MTLVPLRKFRTDFLHEASKTCIEVNGYIDHSSRKGFTRDHEKHFLLAMEGYQVITLDRPLITEENVKRLVEFVSRYRR